MLRVLKIKHLCSPTMKRIAFGLHIGTLLHLYVMWLSVENLTYTHDACDRF